MSAHSYSNTRVTTKRDHLRFRLRMAGVAVAVASLSLLAPVGPGAPTPAGAWGVAPAGAIGCNASGFSGRWNDWIGVTSNSTCGSNWVRFRGWGFVGSWSSAVTPTNALVSSPTDYLLGGADHRACVGCVIVGT